MESKQRISVEVPEIEVVPIDKDDGQATMEIKGEEVIWWQTGLVIAGAALLIAIGAAIVIWWLL